MGPSRASGKPRPSGRAGARDGPAPGGPREAESAVTVMLTPAARRAPILRGANPRPPRAEGAVPGGGAAAGPGAAPVSRWRSEGG